MTTTHIQAEAKKRFEEELGQMGEMYYGKDGPTVKKVTISINDIKDFLSTEIATAITAYKESLCERVEGMKKTEVGRGRWCKTCNGSIDGEHHRAWCETYDEALTDIIRLIKEL